MKHTKTGWITTLIAVLVIVCGGIAIKLWPRTVPVEDCSPVYGKYAGMPGCEVSYIKDYHVNDTTFVDVTIIHASTDSAWTVLSRKFDIFIIPAEYKKLFEMDNVELNFDDDVLKLIAEKSLKRKSGARGLRTITEKILLDTMYDVPNGNWKKITVKCKDNSFYIEKQNNSVQEVIKVGGFSTEKNKQNDNTTDDQQIEKVS